MDCGTGEDPEGTVSAGADGDEVSSSHGYAGFDVAPLGGNDVVVNDGRVDEPDPSPNNHEKSSLPLPLPDEFDDPPSLPAMSRAAATIQSPISFVGGWPVGVADTCEYDVCCLAASQYFNSEDTLNRSEFA